MSGTTISGFVASGGKFFYTLPLCRPRFHLRERGKEGEERRLFAQGVGSLRSGPLNKLLNEFFISSLLTAKIICQNLPFYAPQYPSFEF